MFVHEIQLEETNQFSKDFNYIGRLWQKAISNDKDQDIWFERFFEAKLCLEQGNPIGYYEGI